MSKTISTTGRPSKKKKTGRSASMSVNEKGERVIRITFNFSHDILHKVRTLPGRIYHKELECWSAPIYMDSLNSLLSWGFTLDDKLIRYMRLTKVRKRQIVVSEIDGLQGELYPFQKEGVAFLELNNGRALIADEMGLGKTIQALAWLQLHPEHRPAIIVVPASLKLNWKKEIDNWMSPQRIDILNGTIPRPIKGRIVIVNYDILRYWVNTIRMLYPQVLITDECHYFKNNKAERTRAVKKVARGIPHVIAISGTPIVNRPIEAFNAINLVNPTLFDNYISFGKRYCGANNNGFGWDFSGATHIKELHTKLTTTVMIRRLKKDVLKELPEKTRALIPVELDNTAEYISAERDFIAYLRENKDNDAVLRAQRAIQFARIAALKQLAVKGKLKYVVDWIRDFLESGEKLVVFVTHRTTLARLMEEFSDIAVSMHGGLSAIQKQHAEKEFQTNPDVQLFIGILDVEGKPAGVGLTLTAASCTATVELQWSPGVHKQAEDRIHRIGQKNAVISYYLLATGTIEERIATIIDYKQRILDGTLDGIESDQENLLTELIKSYLNDETKT